MSSIIVDRESLNIFPAALPTTVGANLPAQSPGADMMLTVNPGNTARVVTHLGRNGFSMGSRPARANALSARGPSGRPVARSGPAVCSRSHLRSLHEF